MDVVLDATPLLGVRTGVGRYVERLTEELARNEAVRLTATAFSLRGRTALSGAVPPGVRTVTRPLPARLLRAAWTHHEAPSIDRLVGRHDVFHGTNFVLPPTGRRTRGVVTVHDLSFLRVADSVHVDSLAYRHLVPRSIARSARVLTPSRAVADEVITEYGLEADDVTVTPLGVDESWFEPGVAPGPGLPDDYFLAVGTLEPRKGLQRLVDAHRELRAQRTDVPALVLVGPHGWGPTIHRNEADQDAVRLTGFLDDARLRAVVRGARALVFPSRYEGFGLPPLEALASGTAVIASDLPVTREVLDDQATYVGDDDELGQAMSDHAAGRSTGTSASRAARARLFTWARCADLTLAAYDEVSPARQPRGR